tara:strand:+ start:402 stop:593 length:192 start_codon:yes stop_codon:yes gene_type:complete
MINDFLDNLGSNQYEKMHRQKLIKQIEKLALELNGTMQKSLRSDPYGRQSKIITIEYDVTETK